MNVYDDDEKRAQVRAWHIEAGRDGSTFVEPKGFIDVRTMDGLDVAIAVYAADSGSTQ